MAHDPLRNASRHTTRRRQGLVETDREAELSAPTECVRHEVGGREGLFHADDVEVGEGAQELDGVLGGVRAVRVDLQARDPDGPHAPSNRLDAPSPARSSGGPGRRRWPRHGRPLRGARRCRGRAGCRPPRRTAWTRSRSRSGATAPGSGPAHATRRRATAISKAAARTRSSGRGAEELWHLGPVGSRPPRAAAALRERGTAVSAADPFDRGELRVDTGAVGQRRALAPALSLARRRPGRRATVRNWCTPAAVPSRRGKGCRPAPARRRSASVPRGRPPRHGRSGLVRSGVPARMAEWQTRRPQKPLSERACGFESRSGHARMGRADPAHLVLSGSDGAPDCVWPAVALRAVDCRVTRNSQSCESRVTSGAQDGIWLEAFRRPL